MSIGIKVYANGDDAFVAWNPKQFLPGCRGFLLERGRKKASGEQVEPVENRVGFQKDKPNSGDHRPSDFWPFQRFNWTDHAVDVGNEEIPLELGSDWEAIARLKEEDAIP